MQSNQHINALKENLVAYFEDNIEVGFQRELNLDKFKFCFKYEYNDPSRLTIGVNDRSNFLNKIKHLKDQTTIQNTFYELIRGKDKVAEYYDIDFKYEGELDVVEKSHTIINDLLEARNNVLYGNTPPITRRDIIVLEAHRPSKLSLHIISLKSYYINSKAQLIIATKIQNELEKELETNFTIDTSVYKNNQCFRMLGNRKYQSEATLKVFEPFMYNSCTLEDSLVVLENTDNRYCIGIVDELIQMDSREITPSMDCATCPADMLRHLNKFIRDYPYFAIRGKRLDRTDGVTRKCLVSKDKHSVENMYWFLTDMGIFVNCFCNNGKPLCIGTREGITPIDRIKPTTFKYTTHYSENVNDLTQFLPFRTIFDKTRTGGGKTTKAMKLSKEYKNVLVIHNRVSLDDDYTSKYPEFTSYSDEIDSPKQTICFNSLARLSNIGMYDLIIIDEIRSVLRQSQMKNTLDAVTCLFGIFESDTPLICLDANMRNEDVEFIQKYRKDPNAVYISNQFQTSNKNVFFINTKEHIYYLIEETLRAGKKIVLPYNTNVEVMDVLLNHYREQKYTTLHINRFTRQQISIDPEDLKAYDIIAFSPTISEGVSIEDAYFKEHVCIGMFTQISCPAETTSQMIARFRNLTTIYIFVDDKRSKSFPYYNTISDVRVQCETNINEMTYFSHGHLNFIRKGFKHHIITDEYFELYAKNMIELSRDYNFYVDTLKQLLVNNGYNLYMYILPENNDYLKYKEFQKQIRDDAKTRHIEDVTKAPPLTHEESLELRDKGCSTYLEKYALEKYDICKSIYLKPQALTDEICEEFMSGSIQSKIHNLRKCFKFYFHNGQYVREAVGDLISDITERQLTEFQNSKSFGLQQNTIKSKLGTKLGFINIWAKKLGFREITTPYPVSNAIFTANMNQLVKLYRSSFMDFKRVQLVFNEKVSKVKWETITNRFITDKIRDTLGIVFVNENDKIYQVCNIPIIFNTTKGDKPTLLCLDFDDSDIVHDYHRMFNALTMKCEICDTAPRKSCVKYTHYHTKTHLANLEKQGKVRIIIDTPIEDEKMEIHCSIEGCNFIGGSEQEINNHFETRVHDNLHCDICKKWYYNEQSYTEHQERNIHYNPRRLQ
jgi:hypothetical protein